MILRLWPGQESGENVNRVAEQGGRGSSIRTERLRTNSFAGIVALLFEFGLGVGVNLYVKLPRADSGKSLFPAFGKAVSGSPTVLALHAVLGTLLLINGITTIMRALRIRARVLLGFASVAFVAIVAAWLSGARFVGHASNGASLTMAIATGIALLCYASILFVAGRSVSVTDTPGQ
jgi:hypothetical protein